MKAKKGDRNLRLFEFRLAQIINLKHELCVLAGEIDWTVFELEFGPHYSEGKGRPAKPIRLLVGLHYLKHAFNESDESVVDRLLENPYWQHFCGFEYFQHEFPIDPTTLVKWRRRVGPKGLEKLLCETVAAAKRKGFLGKRELERMNVDTTVQEKAIAFPTDARLYEKMRTKLVQAAKERDVRLRQTYVRKGPKAFLKQHRYRHASQHKRANKMLKKLKTYLGRVVRDIRRKVEKPDEELSALLAQADRLLAQERNSKKKLYSLHAPEAECIAKGKAHKKYEFGVKAGVVATSKNCWIVGAATFPGNPYDGHTLAASIEQAERISGVEVKHIHVDKGYRGHDYKGPAKVRVTGMGGKKKTLAERKWRRRRSAIEPVIGHAKHDHRMLRSYLKGSDGDEMNAVLAACGYNLRKLLRAFFLPRVARLLSLAGGLVSARITNSGRKAALPANVAAG